MTPADEGKLLAELWGVLTETQKCELSRRGEAMRAVLLRYEESGAPYRSPMARYCYENIGELELEAEPLHFGRCNCPACPHGVTRLQAALENATKMPGLTQFLPEVVEAYPDYCERKWEQATK